MGSLANLLLLNLTMVISTICRTPLSDSLGPIGRSGIACTRETHPVLLLAGIAAASKRDQTLGLQTRDRWSPRLAVWRSSTAAMLIPAMFSPADSGVRGVLSLIARKCLDIVGRCG